MSGRIRYTEEFKHQKMTKKTQKLSKKLKNETQEKTDDNSWYKLLKVCTNYDREKNLDEGTTWNRFLKKVMHPNTSESDANDGLFGKARNLMKRLREPYGKTKWESVEQIEEDTFEEIKNLLSEKDVLNIYQFTVNFSDPFISFARVEFNQFTLFDGCIFPVRVAFWDAKFKSEVHFRDCVFLKGANFDGVEFFSPAIFTNISSVGFIGFSRATFHHMCDLSLSNFHGSVDFSRVTFQRNLILTRSHFRGLPPNFSNTELPENVDWLWVTWPNKPKKHHFPGNYISRYQILYKRMNDMERHIDKQLFFGLEMKARRANAYQEKEYPIWLISYLYSVLAGYGSSISRALFFWASNILVGAYLIYPSSEEVSQDKYEYLGSSLAVSFSNAHSFLGLYRGALVDLYKQFPKGKSTISFDLVWTIQAVLGPVLIFLVLLTIRNRFRLR